MAGSLTHAQVEHFRREGYAFPFDAIPAAEAASYVAKLDSYDAILGEEAQKQLKIKAHVAAPWIVALARNKNILDAVESLIGPDILLFGASLFSKKARDVRFVSWHQDAAYYGLDPQEEVTCWVGLTDADIENFDPQNMLGRGQTIRGIDDSKAVYMPVKAGQFSMHHERTIHGSMPNPSDRRRVGISFFYMPTHVRSTVGRRTATLVRGTDKYGHWDTEPMPKTDLDPVCMEFLRQSWSRYRDPDVPQAAKLKAS
jgi:non-heme Fe2+,alpha-ketoglutarate-dependent halogenase